MELNDIKVGETYTYSTRDAAGQVASTKQVTVDALGGHGLNQWIRYHAGAVNSVEPLTTFFRAIC